MIKAINARKIRMVNTIRHSAGGGRYHEAHDEQHDETNDETNDEARDGPSGSLQRGGNDEANEKPNDKNN